MSAFSENLKFIMDSRGITSKELSYKAEIKYDTINSYLKTDGPEPSALKAVLIANVLGTSVEYLITGKEKSVLNTFSKENLDLMKLLERLSEKDLDFIRSLAERFLNK